MLTRLYQMLEEEIKLSSSSSGNTIDCFADSLQEIYFLSRSQLRSFAWSLSSHSDFFAQYRIAKEECDSLTEKCKTYLQNPLAHNSDHIAMLRAELRRVAALLQKYSDARDVLVLMEAHDKEMGQLSEQAHAPAAPVRRY